MPCIVITVFNIDVFLISVEIILRAEAVEQAQAGDKCDFTGTLIVVPDVAQLSTPGMFAYLHCNCLLTLCCHGKKKIDIQWTSAVI